MSHRQKLLIPMLLAAVATLPGLYLRFFTPLHDLLTTHPALVALCTGIAVLGASFLLLWACDAVQMDISQTLALAVVALIAVLPEYAVDMYFTWQAGQHPGGEYAHFAIANMTGANRLLIGIGWTVIVGVYWLRTRKAVRLEQDRRTEIFFLGLATAYAFVVALKGSLAWYDGIVFLGLYIWYIVLAGKRPVEESEAEGPAELLMGLPKMPRRLVTLGLFLFAALVILASAEPFSEGLVKTGTQFLPGKEFLFVQWLAPIASEAPEFILAIMFALRGRANMALGSLLSSKLNQWTLLVGMIPGVYALSTKALHPPIPMNGFQMHEIMLTAAQSLLGVLLLASLSLSAGQALLLFGLFVGQFIIPTVMKSFPALAQYALRDDQVHPIFSLVYILITVALFLDQPQRIRGIWQGARPYAEPSDAVVFPDDAALAEEDAETVR